MQQLLTATFNGTKIQDRLLSTNTEGSYFNFINYKELRGGFFCADFFGYERGRIAQVIREAFDQEQIDPSALPLQKAADGTDQQYLDGKLYFVCKGNHLIIAQDMHIKGQQLERYLAKMIRQRCAYYPEEQSFLLERSISQKARKDIKGVKKIHLSAPLEYEPKKQKGGTDKTPDVVSVPVGHAWKAIKELIGDRLDLTQFSTNGFIDPQEIDVTVSLSWKRKRGQTISDQLDTLANTFRHVDEELDFELETNSGAIKKDELRLSHPQSVQHENDLPIREDIFDKMIQWYGYLVQAGEIG